MLSRIPQIDRLLSDRSIQAFLQNYPRSLVIKIIRKEIQSLRTQIRHPVSADDAEKLVDYPAVIHRLTRVLSTELQPRVRHVINATGIVLHTGLGRAPLSAAAQGALYDAAKGFALVEYRLDSGRRGDRHEIVEDMLVDLTGAEAAAVVNNNAAATLLVLNTLAEGKSAVVSRGELVTIGGSFRIPDIMQRSGARMVEVGTTNKTNQRDYEQAIDEETALLMKIHTSNYRIVGFHEEVGLAALVVLGRKHTVPVLHDLGSGSLIDLSRFNLPKEPVVRESIAAGADIVTFSGDKLLGGPQAGIIVGRKSYIDRIKANQLTRALRCGKLTFAALEATLRLFYDEEKLVQHHRVLQMLTQPIATIKRRANRLVRKLKPHLEGQGFAGVRAGLAEVGGGSLATESFPTALVSLKFHKISEHDLARALRMGTPPIIPRVQKGQVLLDMFTVMDREVPVIIDRIAEIVRD